MLGRRLHLIPIFISLLGFTVPAAASIDDEFNRLKKAPVDFNNFGQVCEAVAEHQYLARFPAPAFQIVNGVAYGDQDGTLGELDIVILDGSTETVVAIAEVKCWRDSTSALSKANEQKLRFQEALRSGQPLSFKNLQNQKEYAPEQFQTSVAFETVGPLGVKAHGFDVELEYSLNELMELRERLIKCKSNRRCK